MLNRIRSLRAAIFFAFLISLIVLFISPLFYMDSNRTDFDVEVETTEMGRFFKGYETLLIDEGFELWETYKTDGATDASTIVDGSLMVCEGVVVSGIVKLKCLDTWMPVLPFLRARVSKDHDELVKTITGYAQPLGLVKIERVYYDSTSEILYPPEDGG